MIRLGGLNSVDLAPCELQLATSDVKGKHQLLLRSFSFGLLATDIAIVNTARDQGSEDSREGGPAHQRPGKEVEPRDVFFFRLYRRLLLYSRKDSLGEAWRSFLSPKRSLQKFIDMLHILIWRIHITTSPMVRVIFSRNMARDLCRWLFTVAKGMARATAMSSGDMSSW